MKLSVIVPVYNVENYISRCLDSILNQEVDDIEVIVINDGSKDGSQLIIDQYVKKYPNIIYSYQKKNGGLSDARNFGFQFATGDYIAFLDSDDYLYPNAYNLLLSASNNGQKNIVSCGYSMDFPQKSIIVTDNRPQIISDYIANGLVVAWNKIYKKEWLLATNIKFPKGLLYEDTEFFCKLLCHITSLDDITFVNMPLIHYIQRGDSISYSTSSKVDDIHLICDNIFRYYSENNICKEYRDAVEYKFVKALLGNFFLKYCRIDNKKEKRQGLLKNWQYITSNFSNWKHNPYIINNDSKLVKMYLKNMNYFFYKILSTTPVCLLERIVGK